MVDRIIKELEDGEGANVRRWSDWTNEVARNTEGADDAIVGNDKSTSHPRRYGELGSNISRKGRGFDSPNLYVKAERADRFGIDDVWMQ